MQPDAVGFLACGWALASTKTHGTSIALRDGERTILVDAGGSPAKELVRTFGLEGLDRIYLTHEHPDHTWGLPGLLHCLRFAGERGPLSVHGPRTAIERAKAAVDALGVTTPFEVAWRAIPSAGGEDGLASWVPTEHSVPTLAYRFDDVVICGDTGPCPGVVDLSRGASLLVHEATHTDEDRTHRSGHATPTDAGAAARNAGVDTLAIIHVHPSLSLEKAREGAGFEPTIAPVDGQIATRQGPTWTLEA